MFFANARRGHERACKHLLRRITNMVEMFRITHSRSQVEHIEGRRVLASRLLELESLSLATKDRWDSPKFSTSVEKMFRARKGKGSSTRGPFAISVEKFVAGDWVVVEYQFVPSYLVLDGETYDD